MISVIESSLSCPISTTFFCNDISVNRSKSLIEDVNCYYAEFLSLIGLGTGRCIETEILLISWLIMYYLINTYRQNVNLICLIDLKVECGVCSVANYTIFWHLLIAKKRKSSWRPVYTLQYSAKKKFRFNIVFEGPLERDHPFSLLDLKCFVV